MNNMSRIFDLIESRIIPVVEYGYFKIETVILEIDYPRCFIASNQGNFYAFLEIENDDELFGWNVARVSLDDINHVNLGTKNVQSLFDNKPLYELIFHNADCGILTAVQSFRDKYAIVGDIKISGFCDMDETFDYHGFGHAAKVENSNKVNMVYENQHSCSTNLVLNAISYMKSVMNNLNHPLNILNSDFSVMHKSTVITFTFNDNDGPLFNDNNIEPSSTKGIVELGNVLSTDDSVALLENQNKKTEKILKKYNKLLETLQKSDDSHPKIVLAMASKEKPISYDMSKRGTKNKKAAVIKALDYIKEKSVVKKEPITCKGILTGIITSGGNFFRFFDEKRRVYYSGAVDFNILGMNAFDVNGSRYFAQIEKILVYSETGEVTKESYKLVALEFIERIEQFNQINLFDECKSN